jgi:hypothetical protein
MKNKISGHMSFGIPDFLSVIALYKFYILHVYTRYIISPVGFVYLCLFCTLVTNWQSVTNAFYLLSNTIVVRHCWQALRHCWQACTSENSLRFAMTPSVKAGISLGGCLLYKQAGSHTIDGCPTTHYTRGNEWNPYSVEFALFFCITKSTLYPYYFHILYPLA